MFSSYFANLAHWLFHLESYLPAVAVALGAALLLGCGVSAICSPCREKDSFFHKQVV